MTIRKESIANERQFYFIVRLINSSPVFLARQAKPLDSLGFPLPMFPTCGPEVNAINLAGSMDLLLHLTHAHTLLPNTAEFYYFIFFN